MPWLHRAKLTKVKLVRKSKGEDRLNSMWAFTLSTAGVEAAAAEAAQPSLAIGGAVPKIPPGLKAKTSELALVQPAVRAAERPSLPVVPS